MGDGDGEIWGADLAEAVRPLSAAEQLAARVTAAEQLAARVKGLQRMEAEKWRAEFADQRRIRSPFESVTSLRDAAAPEVAGSARTAGHTKRGHGGARPGAGRKKRTPYEMERNEKEAARAEHRDDRARIGKELLEAGTKRGHGVLLGRLKRTTATAQVPRD